MTDDTFTYRGHTLRYLDHPYNCTRLNERAIEVPIAEAFLQRVMCWYPNGPCTCVLTHKSARTFVEIGNVLSHYGLRRTGMVCLDRDEDAEDTIREDVRSWGPGCQLDAVVSISTFEHVGQDEDRWEDAWPAIERVADMLAPDGSMLVTIGLGQNPALDEVLLGGATSAATADTFVSSQCVEHAGAHRIWYETGTDEIRPYVGHSGMGAGAVWVGQFGRPVL